MYQQRSLAKPRNRLFAKLCACLVKGFGQGLLGLTLALLVLGCFGFPLLVMTLWTELVPWVVRAAVMISCILTVHSISESW